MSAVAVAMTVAALAAAPAPDAAHVCGSPSSHVTAHRYVVKARVRPLLFWTGFRDVGAAWFESRESEGGGRKMKLLVGTDPERTPMKINRWGYIAETLCDGRAELVGLMTESNEQSIEEARTRTSAPQGQLFKAIRARATGRTVATEVVTIAPGRPVTYRDLEGILAQLPPAGVMRETSLADDVDSGFLAAVTGLIHDSVSGYRMDGRVPSGLRRTYVYAGRLYDASLRSATVSRDRGVIDGEFQVLNRTTGSTTAFRIAYGAEGTDAEVPARITYRPRWWLEVDLQLESP
jgi:hypothetical protein